MKRRLTSFHTKPRKPLKRSNFKSKPSKPKTRKVTQAAKTRRKKGIWATSTADQYFSKWIRARDGKCKRCKTKNGLTCSHYHGRKHSATRFDPKNCVALCWECHQDWEGPKNGYTEFMIEWLGEKEFLQLAIRAGSIVKRSDAVAEFKAWYKNNPQTQEIIT